MRLSAISGLLAGLLVVPPLAHSAEPPGKIATFSICAVDPESGLCGAAVASKYPAVGKVVAHARAGVGAFCTQHYGVQKWGEPALDALAAGTRPEQVIADLLKGDNQPEQRQLGIVDMKGQTAVHNPTQAGKGSNYWAAMTGRNYCVQGNTLVGREVITEMAKTYEETKGSFADRLVASLLAGDAVGGDHRGRLAAGIRIAKTGTEGYWFELYVDESGDAVVEFVEKYAEQKHEARGDWDPTAALKEAAAQRKKE